MKKQKRPQETKAASPAAQRRSRLPWRPAWWQFLGALAALVLVFAVYGPALNGAFVLDDQSLPFMNPRYTGMPLSFWIAGVRPLLAFSFWINYRLSETDPSSYHVINVLLHFLTSCVIALIAWKLLEWAGVAGRRRALLAAFAGALFMLHPVQTEAVAYVASRSEDLSVLFYFAAFAVFLYRSSESTTLLRAVAVVALFGAAVATKEHTLTLPALLVLTDLFWNRGGLRRNGILYGLLVLTGAVGGAIVWKVLRAADTAGFAIADLPPATYFFTQCRVVWTYVRMFVLPFGLNVDPDVALSRTPFDHGAILGLMALLAALATAWMYRKRWPLASFGVFVFLLLLAPTSSFFPIKDVMAEHRLYLPFLGLVLVCLEILRRIPVREAAWVSTGVLAVCAVLTYQRSQVWGSPMALWEDTVAKSPQKFRPRFQLAYALYQDNRCGEAAQSYETASRLGPAGYELLVDWGLALDCAGSADEAVAKLRQAALFEHSAHVYAELGMVYGKHGRAQEALDALAEAEKIDPRFAMIYVYRGNVFATMGDRAAAAREYQHAVVLNPSNQAARDALARVSR